VENQVCELKNVLTSKQRAPNELIGGTQNWQQAVFRAEAQRNEEGMIDDLVLYVCCYLLQCDCR
jgi:hypothetical protein